MKFSQIAVIAAVSALALSSCSGDDGDEDEDNGDGAKPSSTSSSGVVSPPDLPEIPTLQKPVGIIDDVEVEDCTLDPGKAEANGTATNSAKQVKDLVVTISWTAGSTGDVIGRGVAELKDVAPGATEDWSVEAKLPEAEGIQCVPSAQAGQLK